MIYCRDPHAFFIQAALGKWFVCLGDRRWPTVISECDSEREAQDVQAALVVAAAGRA